MRLRPHDVNLSTPRSSQTLRQLALLSYMRDNWLITYCARCIASPIDLSGLDYVLVGPSSFIVGDTQYD